MEIGEASQSGAGGSNSTRSGVALRFVEILGLYQPGHDDSGARTDGRRIGCGYRPGYWSADDRGRIFINHAPRADASAPWQQARQRDTQYIDVTVAVRGRGGPLPAGIEVEWEWSDPDDGSDARMHSAAADHVDANASGADDNQGQCDFPSPGSGSEAAFEQIAGFALTPGGSASQCRTAVVNNSSQVRLHCTNVGGDNFRLTARVSHAQGPAEVQTGLMTMWKRIDVEYKLLSGAYTLPVGFARDLQQRFDPCFVQFDVTPLQIVQSASAHLVQHDRDVEAGAARLASSPSNGGIFDHAGQPGWFLLVAAKNASADLATGRGNAIGNFSATVVAQTYNSSVPSLQNGEALQVSGRVGGRVALVFIKNPNVTADRPETAITIPVWRTEYRPAGDLTLLYLQATTVVRQFDGGDGSTANAYAHQMMYYPSHRYVADSGAWEAGGMGLSGTLDVALYGPGSWLTNGISPTRSSHFAGRTILFTHVASPTPTLDADPMFSASIVHELGHAFGMPHRCGYHAWTDPANQSCTMNYSNNWLFEPGTDTIQPFNTGTRGRNFCAHHIRAIREVHLEDNPQMWTW